MRGLVELISLASMYNKTNVGGAMGALSNVFFILYIINESGTFLKFEAARGQMLPQKQPQHNILT